MLIEEKSSAHPLVSVVIPLYNRRRSILNAVESALAQDYPNLEIVIVDDGSTDDSAARLQTIFDSRLHLCQQSNQGACAARNYGIKSAHGKYVAMLDSDDVFLPGHIRQSVEILENAITPCVVYGRIIVDRGNGRTFLKPPRGIHADEDMSEYLLCDQGFVQTSTVVLPRELAMRIGYDRSLRFGQDTDFAIRLSHAGATFVFLAHPQAIWSDRFGADRVSNALDPNERLRWLDQLVGVITTKARIGDEGWYVAKSFFKRGRRATATFLYLKAVAKNSYRARLAVRIALQIFLSSSLYRKLADMVLRASQK